MNLQFMTRKGRSLRRNSDYAASDSNSPNPKAKPEGKWKSHAKVKAAYWFAFRTEAKLLAGLDMLLRGGGRPSNLRSRMGSAVDH